MLGIAACGGGHGHTPDAASSDTAAADAAVDAAPPRLQLASSGTQLIVTGPQLGFQITAADLGEDADVIEIHQEFYGVPWDAFVAGTQPPAAWVAIMDGIAADAKASGKPVFLSVSMLNGQRDSLAAKTTVDASGQVNATDGWAASCYDFGSAPDAATYRAAYLAYVQWMLDEFHPTYLNFAIEVNLFFEKCPTAAAGLVAVANATYAMAKADDPALVAAFPSIQIDHLYGYSTDSCPDQSQRDACFDQLYAEIVPLQRDRFAMSSYPQLSGLTPATLPADWFTRGAARGGERAVVAETGWNSTNLVAQSRDSGCITVLTASDAEPAAYLARVISDGQAAHMDFVNWWSDRDLVVAPLMTDCPCTFDATWCAVLDAFRGPPTTSGPDTQLLGEIGLKAFAAMGVRAYDGSAKSFYATWAAARD
ncbi:MAG TPA: hypothetical protein VLX92_20365 [Kofleriaceae bacterium]|nr:hypothetical protein [Kofleriaceae bacterium]